MKYLCTPILFCTLLSLAAQDLSIPLYTQAIPCSNKLSQEVWVVGNTGRRIAKVHEPSMDVYLAPRHIATGTSVVICPGGGYTVLAWDWEGTRMAEWFNKMGVTAFVLKYRLPHWESASCRDKVALMDAQRAMRIVRKRAEEFEINPIRVGVMGFSAGGHLASTLSTHFDHGDPAADSLVDRYSCRPDFSILMYPVISMDTTFGHMGSQRNLIGRNPSEEERHYFSNEKQVSAETPPTLLIHASDDLSVKVENSIVYYQALRKHNVPTAMHIYESGGHGFSFAKDLGAVADWPGACKSWMHERGLLGAKMKALIIEGQNNHKNWQETTPILAKQLTQTGLFEVDIVRTPSDGKSMENFRPDFDRYEVVVSNYNGDSWPEETKRHFEKYVSSGGGFISIHAADNSFPTWEAYNEMIGIGGWYGRTEKDGPYIYMNDLGEIIRDVSPGKGGHHGKQHEFMVEIRDKVHPITKGIPDKWLHAKDELYDQLRGPANNLHILATAFSDESTGGTGRHEPMLMTINFGAGRVFHTTLGHLNESMRCLGFKITFQRAAEWAAKGYVNQPLPKVVPSPDEVRFGME
ncbi:MAG: alpha/beta hydrolase fold domain-containing protein [Saprospiraceae bacterium]|nr:alpha/beta hydrolase fold domain-containing protein [Saprospiraceae bacterium]